MVTNQDAENFSKKYFHTREFVFFEELVKQGDQNIPVLLKILSDTREPLYRYRAIRLLGHIGNSKHIPILKELMLNKNPFQRAIVILALKQIGGKESEHLILRYMYDPDVSVRKFVFRSLGVIGTEKSIAELKSYLPIESDPNLIKEIQKSILKLTIRNQSFHDLI